MLDASALRVRRYAKAGACAAVLVASVAPAQAAFPGRNGRIAYADPDGGISSVWPNGTGRQQLVGHGYDPAYSPGGDRLAYQDTYTLNVAPNPFIDSLYLTRVESVRADGRGYSVLTTDAQDDSPAWAPDGRRLVFSRDGGLCSIAGYDYECPAELLRLEKRGGIVVRRRDGRTRIVSDGWNPAWAPDGTLISYVLAEPSINDQSLYVIKPDGTHVRLLAPRRGYVGSPDWSPDGSRVVFSSHTIRELISGKDPSIAVVRRDGTHLRRLVRGGGPAYSPDGRWIVFVRVSQPRGLSYRECDENGGLMLWLIRARGGRPRPLKDRSGEPVCGAAPTWQPLPIGTQHP